MTTQTNTNDISLKEQVMTKIKLGQRWFGKKEAAEYYNIKPTTINKYISLYGHDAHIIWTKLHGKVLIDIFETDRKITNGN
tara:strand:- start:862 stop:1104 length:243 start_codon:yes stop_codon:yes gene_type:complete